MEVTLPETMTLTIGGIVAFMTIYGSLLGIYYRLSASLKSLQGKINDMEQRNIHADAETEAVKAEQAAQKTTVAVMAEQIVGITRTLERIDRNVEGLVKSRSGQ